MRHDIPVAGVRLGLFVATLVLGVTGCASTAVPAQAPVPTTVKTTWIRVSGTIERPGGLLTPRKGGEPCSSAMGDDIREGTGWWIIAGNEILGGGRLGPGLVRDDVNPYGNPPDGPCSFPFDDTIDMPASGDVFLAIGNEKMPVNRLDLLAGPTTIRTSISGRLYRGIPGTEGIKATPQTMPLITMGS